MTTFKNIIVRPEQTHEYRLLERIVRDAFWNVYVPGASEHYIVHKIRQSKDYLPRYSLVLEVDGKVVGGIYYSRSWIATCEEKIPVATFAPIFIDPRYQGQGLGHRLLQESIARVRRNHENAIVILGYPHHYEGVGFQAAANVGITFPDGATHRGLQVLILNRERSNWAGKVEFSADLEVSDEEVFRFDRTFPKKEKRETVTQKEFQDFLMQG